MQARCSSLVKKTAGSLLLAIGYPQTANLS